MKDRREITNADISRIESQMLAVFPQSSASAGREDFVAAGMVGLVEAADEYDDERRGWVKLSRWRAIERARELLRWRMRTEADCSLDTLVHSPKNTDGHDTYRRDTLGTRDPEPDETAAMAQLILDFVTGTVRRRIAYLSWVGQLSVAQVAARLRVHPATVSSHLTYARQQAFEAIALLWPGSPVHRACGVLASTYGPEPVAAQRQRRRDRQHGRAVRAAPDERERTARRAADESRCRVG